MQAAFYLLEGNWETFAGQTKDSVSKAEFQKLLRDKHTTIESMFPGLQYPGKPVKGEDLKSLFKSLIIKFKKQKQGTRDESFVAFKNKLPDFSYEEL